MQRIDLNGRWQFRQTNSETWMQGQVPGSVQGDLLRLKQIPDPFVRRNELDTLWVGRTDWEYRRTVRVSSRFLKARRQLLVCDGLDTVATIWINGQKAGESDNMFRHYAFDMAPFLKAGENEIRIVFSSPVNEAKRRAESSQSTLRSINLPIAEPHRTALRKSQYQSGWDWGPCIATAGIWDRISLCAYDAPRILHSATTQEFLDSGAVRLRVKTWLDVPAPCGGRLAVELGEQSAQAGLVSLAEGEQTVEAEMIVEQPELWWPNGQGQAHLYPLAIEWRDENGMAQDRVTRRIGLRKVELVREADEKGESFYFRINGRAIFAKGANWIPGDALLERVTPAVYERDLRACAAANMNMVRVWGGGIYEREFFYDLCDELGLMVWQDFMFACGLYPGETDFLANVEAEARQQMRRLHDHASIVLWCGNNENEVGLAQWWQATPEVIRDYNALYCDTLGRVAREENPSLPYWPSSPSNGSGTGEPQDETRGDIHYWKVWHGGQRIEVYETIFPRFCSEFGFQSFPAIETLKTVASKEDLNPCSPVMDHHQRSGNGNKNIIEHLAYNLRFPFRFDRFCYASQVLQAMAIQTAVEHWRRLKPYCMGTLFWQVNDCWPVASWSSIDYMGRWKALHYLARRFYAPLLASSRIEGDHLQLWATSDLPLALQGRWQIEVWDFAGERHKDFSSDWSLAANENQHVAALALNEIFANKRERTQRFATLSLQANPPAETMNDVGIRADNLASSHVRLFCPPKAIDWQAPNIHAQVEETNGQLQVRLRTEKPAFFVELSTGSLHGIFSDNWLHLIPGIERVVQFDGRKPITAAQLQRVLRVNSLFDSYQN